MKFFNSLLAVVATAFFFSTQLVHAFDWGTICDQPAFRGNCTTYQSSSINKCVNFTGKDRFWDNKISSLSVINKIDTVNFVVNCIFSVEPDCSGDSLAMLEGSYDTMPAATPPFDDNFTSFRCFTESKKMVKSRRWHSQ